MESGEREKIEDRRSMQLYSPELLELLFYHENATLAFVLIAYQRQFQKMQCFSPNRAIRPCFLDVLRPAARCPRSALLQSRCLRAVVAVRAVPVSA